MSGITDVTPEGSVVVVLLDSAPKVPVEELVLNTFNEERQAGIDKLVAWGLTEGEAKAIARQ